MENNRKSIIITSIITLLLIIVTLSGTFAFYNYSKTSRDTKMIAGDIYMRYNNGEAKSISIIPSDTYRIDDYYEFTIEGKNESDKNIIYDIKLNHGNDDNTKTRLDDKYLRFRLVTVNENNQETEIIKEAAYENINNTTIHVDTIGTTNIEVSTKYRLYTWVNGVSYGNVPGVTYTEEEWKNLYTNISVDVNGNFEEKTKDKSVLITFDGEETEISPKILSGETFGNLPTPKRSKYVFGGWYLEDTYETKVTETTPLPKVDNLKLYAK